MLNTRTLIKLVFGLSLFIANPSYNKTNSKLLKTHPVKAPASQSETLNEKILSSISPNEVIAIANELIQMLHDEAINTQERQTVLIHASEIAKLAYSIRDTIAQRKEAPVGIIFGLGFDIWAPKLANLSFQGSLGVLILKIESEYRFFFISLGGPGIELGRVLGPLTRNGTDSLHKAANKNTEDSISLPSEDKNIVQVQNINRKLDAIENSFLFSGGVIFGNTDRNNDVITKASDILGGLPYVGVDYESSSRIKFGGGLFVRPELPSHTTSSDPKTLIENIGIETSSFATELFNATKGLSPSAAWKAIKKRSSASMLLIYAGVGTKTSHNKVQGQVLFLNPVGGMDKIHEAFFNTESP